MKKFLKGLLTAVLVIALIVIALTVANRINEASLLEYINSFDKVEIKDQLVPALDENGDYYFTTDRPLRVMHLTDLHLTGGIFYAGNDRRVLNAVAAMIAEEKPDLVVITGDISFAVPWSGTLNNRYAHSYAISLFERLGVYWTVAFGNHDSENYNPYNRAAVADMYENESLEYCLFSSGPENIFGECNHAINVRNTDGIITESLIMIDTNAYTEEDIFGLGWDYDKIHDDQIEWYRGRIESARAYNTAVYGTLSADRQAEYQDLTPRSLLFMHIPIREVKYAYDDYIAAGRQNTADTIYKGGNDGEGDEVVFAPDDDEQLFETILELGSTKALFFGHDHLNNFVLEYKGVALSYGYSMDYSAYVSPTDGTQRGCTMITLADEVEIAHENYYQDKYKPLYEKEEVSLAP